MLAISAAAFCVVLLCRECFDRAACWAPSFAQPLSLRCNRESAVCPRLSTHCCRDVSSSVVDRLFGVTRPPCAVVQDALSPRNRSSPLLAYPMIAGKIRKIIHRLTTLRLVTIHP